MSEQDTAADESVQAVAAEAAVAEAAVPEDTAAQDAVPEDTAAQDAVPEDTAAQDAVSEDTAVDESVHPVAAEAAADEAAADEADEDLSAVLAVPAELDAAVEAILFVVDAPLDSSSLAAALQVPVPEITASIDRLRASYDERHAGIEVRDAAGGVRIYTRPGVAAYVERFLQDGQRSRLSQAALETLAVIAYRQPVTRSRVSAIRGVNVDGVVRTLLSRGLIVEVGTDPESGAGLFRTTELFLERMGMQSLEQLPSLAPLLPELSGLDSDEL